MDDVRDLPPIDVPPVVLPGQHAPESAYRVAHDLLARRTPDLEAMVIAVDVLRHCRRHPRGHTLKGTTTRRRP